MATFPMPSTDNELADLLARWILDRENEVAAALALEDLDPDHHLNSADRSLWRDLLGGVTARLVLDVDARVLDLVRERLHTDPLYARVAGALKDPTSPAGQAFRTALTSFAETGVLGDLLRGSWD